MPKSQMKDYFVAFGDFGGSATPPLGGSVGCPFGGVATPPFWPPAPAAGEAAPAFWTFTMSDCSPVTPVGATDTDDAASTFVPKMSKKPAVTCFASMSWSFLLVGPCAENNALNRRSHGNNLNLRCFLKAAVMNGHQLFGCARLSTLVGAHHHVASVEFYVACDASDDRQFPDKCSRISRDDRLNTTSSAVGLSNLAICAAHEKITAILIVFLPLRALHLQPIAFARLVRRLFSLGHDTFEPAVAAFSE
jgi:hypothetical protein